MPWSAGMRGSGVRIVMLKIPCFSNDDVEKIMDVLFNWDGFFNRLPVAQQGAETRCKTN